MPRSKFARYTCCICERSIRRKQTFEAHMETHFRSKPFECDICDKSFGSRAWLTRHGKIHAGDGMLEVEHVVNGQEAAHCSGTCQTDQELEVSEYGTVVMDPFTIFPREIWCMILENVDYFTDLQNLFKVYPGLEVLYRRKRQLYLFGQVITLISEWVGERDLLNCRRVSRQWNMGVDNFLESHPSRRAYNPDVDHNETGQMWDPSSYSICFHGQSFETRSSGHILYREYFRWKYSFEQRDLLRFLWKMKGHPVELNPFVGRSISLNPGYRIQKSEQLEDYFKTVFMFLSKWGKHIWFLEFSCGRYPLGTQFVNFLQKTLELIPNLRSLHIDMGWMGLKSKDFPKTMPELPHLETLQISRAHVANPFVYPVLFPDYCRQIRRIQFQLVVKAMNNDPREYYSMSLPNLTELVISDIIVSSNDKKWKQLLDNILLSLDAPQLYSLRLNGDPSYSSRVASTYWKDSEIFMWLQRFPGLKHFYLPFPNIGTDIHIHGSDSDVQFKGTSCNHGDFFSTSMQSICLHIDTLTTSPLILHHFPSLQCLQISAALPIWTLANHSWNAEVQVGICLDALHLERLWKVFQDLKKLNVITIMYSYNENLAGRRYRLSKDQIENYLLKKGAI